MQKTGNDSKQRNKKYGSEFVYYPMGQTNWPEALSKMSVMTQTSKLTLVDKKCNKMNIAEKIT